VSPSGTAEPVGGATGGPVGLLAGMTYDEGEASLAPGEALVVFSDGVPEARAEGEGEGEFYGDGRLRAFLERGAKLPARELCDRIAAEIESFQAKRLADDVTVMVLRRAGGIS